MKNKIRFFIIKIFIKLFFTENEKCLFTQALNEQKNHCIKEYNNGFVCHYNFKQDIDELYLLKSFFENKLWK